MCSLAGGGSLLAASGNLTNATSGPALAPEEASGSTVGLGVVIGVVSNVTAAFGMAIQKLGHLQNARRPVEKQRVGLIIGGFLTYTVGSIINLGALALAPQSVVSGLGTLVLVANCFLAPVLLREPLSLRHDVPATTLIIGSTVLVVIFGSKCTPSFTADELQANFVATGHLVFFITLFSVVVAVAFFIRVNELRFRVQEPDFPDEGNENDDDDEGGEVLEKAYGPRSTPRSDDPPKAGSEVRLSVETPPAAMTEPSDPANPSEATPTKVAVAGGAKRRKKAHYIIDEQCYSMSTPRGALMAWGHALVNGSLQAYCIVFSKVISELVKTTILGKEQVSKPLFWIFIFCWIICTAFQISYMNKSLKHFPALFIVPTLQVMFTCIAILSGGIYFQEFVFFDTTQQILFPVGVVLSLCGVVILSTKEVDDGVRIHAAVEEQESMEDGEADGDERGSEEDDINMEQRGEGGDMRMVADGTEHYDHRHGQGGDQGAAGVIGGDATVAGGGDAAGRGAGRSSSPPGSPQSPTSPTSPRGGRGNNRRASDRRGSDRGGGRVQSRRGSASRRRSAGAGGSGGGGSPPRSVASRRPKHKASAKAHAFAGRRPMAMVGGAVNLALMVRTLRKDLRQRQPDKSKGISRANTVSMGTVARVASGEIDASRHDSRGSRGDSAGSGPAGGAGTPDERPLSTGSSGSQASNMGRPMRYASAPPMREFQTSAAAPVQAARPATSGVITDHSNPGALQTGLSAARARRATAMGP